MTTDNTLLRLTGAGIPPYSARGLSQTYEPIQQASQLRRTVNGSLKDLSESQFRKYQCTVSGQDADPPSMDAVWPGQLLTVDWLAELSVLGAETEPATTDEGLFGRTYVPGSVRHADGFTFYRPRMDMRVVSFNVQKDEWGAVTQWQLQLEEV